MRLRKIVITSCLLTASLALTGCTSLQVDNPLNPSYRMVTDQIAAIDSALGTRGGLAVLARTSPPPPSPVTMSHGPSIGAPAEEITEKKLSWSPISRQLSIIENAWDELRPELDRRGLSEIGDTYWYIKYYRMMAVTHDFDMSLASVKSSVLAKDQENIELQVSQLTGAFIQVREELKIAEIDSRKLKFVISGFVAACVALTLTASLVARYRDKRLVEMRRTSRQR